MSDRSRPDSGGRLFTFAVIADTHIRPEEGDESSPWEVNRHANGRARYAVALLSQLAPDFVIHLGDIVHPVPELPTHGLACKAAQAVFAGLEKVVRYVPGNHDVGDKRNEEMPAGQIEERFVEAYVRCFGADYASFDHGGCHFILINAQLINSGFKAEALQWQWLESDLSEHEDERIFLFSHYPPYICEAGEASHYDNIDEPGRARLLRLIERYAVEALFCGHVHGFFYNRHGEMESYTLPATSFFRQDYAELFRIGPAEQFGRNDAEKLGFFLVSVYESNHVVRLIRTGGQELEVGATIAPPMRKVDTFHTKEMAAAPVGVHLRHAWNEITALPYNGPMEEFSRKRARNDYTLLALWELGIRKIRVPLTELLEEPTRNRLAVLKRVGHQVTAFAFDTPIGAVREALGLHLGLIDNLEIILQWRNKDQALPALRRLKRQVGLPVYLTKIETSADKRRAGSRFSHFVSYGFHSSEIADVDEFGKMDGASEAVDGYIFRVGVDRSPWEEIRKIGALAAQRRTKAVVNIRLASESPAAINEDDQLIANQVAETLVAAFAVGTVEVFLDTFVDLDRGYFPRHGLFDRRFNPRLGAFVFRHLNSLLAGLRNPITLGQRLAADSGVVCAFGVGPRQYYLMLPNRSVSPTPLLELINLPVTAQAGGAQWVNLQTGEIVNAPWTKNQRHSALVFDTMPVLAGPVILVFDPPS